MKKLEASLLHVTELEKQLNSEKAKNYSLGQEIKSIKADAETLAKKHVDQEKKNNTVFEVK